MCSNVSFEDREPLVVPEGAKMAVYCDNNELRLGSSLGRIQVQSNVTMEFNNCFLSTFAEGAASQPTSQNIQHVSYVLIMRL